MVYKLLYLFLFFFPGIITEGLSNSFIETYIIKFRKDHKTWKNYKDATSKEKKVSPYTLPNLHPVPWNNTLHQMYVYLFYFNQSGSNFYFFLLCAGVWSLLWWPHNGSQQPVSPNNSPLPPDLAPALAQKSLCTGASAWLSIAWVDSPIPPWWWGFISFSCTYLLLCFFLYEAVDKVLARVSSVWIPRETKF